VNASTTERTLLGIIDQFLAREIDFDTFRELFDPEYFGAPQGTFSDRAEEFFGDVQEDSTYVWAPGDVTAEERAHGTRTAEEYAQWLASAVALYLGGERWGLMP
jgi:hypothetical protein